MHRSYSRTHLGETTQEVNIIHPPPVSSVHNQPVYLSSKHSWKLHTHGDKQAVHHTRTRTHTRHMEIIVV